MSSNNAHKNVHNNWTHTREILVKNCVISITARPRLMIISDHDRKSRPSILIRSPNREFWVRTSNLEVLTQELSQRALNQDSWSRAQMIRLWSEYDQKRQLWSRTESHQAHDNSLVRTRATRDERGQAFLSKKFLNLRLWLIMRHNSWKRKSDSGGLYYSHCKLNLVSLLNSRELREPSRYDWGRDSAACAWRIRLIVDSPCFLSYILDFFAYKLWQSTCSFQAIAADFAFCAFQKKQQTDKSKLISSQVNIAKPTRPPRLMHRLATLESKV